MIRNLFFALILACASPNLVIAQEGFLDNSFADSNGYRTANFDFVPGGSSGDNATAVARSEDGRLTIVGGFRRVSSDNFDCGVMRLLPDAGFDTSFAAPDGFRTLALNLGGNNVDICYDLTVLADGSTWIAGFSRTAPTVNSGFVIRLLANGDVDSNFFSDGVFLFNDDLPAGVSLSSIAYDVAVDSQGRVLVAGAIVRGIAPAQSNRGIVLRFLADGSLDPDFAAGGFAELADFNPPQVNIFAVAEDSQGRLLAAGSTFSAFPNQGVAVVFRLLANGAQDTSFGTGMTALGGGGRGFVPGCTYFPRGLHLDASDRILALCQAASLPAPAPAPPVQLIRLLASGLPDLNFGSAGVAPIAFEYNAAGTAIGMTSELAQILTQADGKVLVTGTHRAAVPADWGAGDIGVLRLLPNGNPDPSFGQDRGASLFRFIGRLQRQENAAAALLEPGGRMVIVGSLARAPVAGSSNLTDFLVMAVRTANAPLPDPLFADNFE